MLGLKSWSNFSAHFAIISENVDSKNVLFECCSDTQIAFKKKKRNYYHLTLKYGVVISYLDS